MIALKKFDTSGKLNQCERKFVVMCKLIRVQYHKKKQLDYDTHRIDTV